MYTNLFWLNKKRQIKSLINPQDLILEVLKVKFPRFREIENQSLLYAMVTIKNTSWGRVRETKNVFKNNIGQKYIKLFLRLK